MSTVVQTLYVHGVLRMAVMLRPHRVIVVTVAVAFQDSQPRRVPRLNYYRGPKLSTKSVDFPRIAASTSSTAKAEFASHRGNKIVREAGLVDADAQIRGLSEDLQP